MDTEAQCARLVTRQKSANMGVIQDSAWIPDAGRLVRQVASYFS